MRATTLGIFAVASGAAAWLLRRRNQDGEALHALEAASSSPLGNADHGGEPLVEEPQSISAARDLDEAQAIVATDEAVRDGEAFDEAAADPAELVEAERQLLTVPGDDGAGHRRRDQTAGVAAQDIAAAHVRQRRYGVDDVD